MQNDNLKFKIKKENNNFFKVLYQSKKSKARLGEIKTDHGVIKTPSFVAVGTKGTVKSILPSLLKEIKTQVAFVNTYHLVTHPGADIIEKAGGIHKYANLDIPLMSDSGGFQVFSLARKINPKSQTLNSKQYQNSNNQSSKQKSFENLNLENSDLFRISDLEFRNSNNNIAVLKISDDGVKFRSVFDGSIIEFTPEKSMEYQKKIGADIIMAFDECIYYGATYDYTKKATKRTHEWLKRCINFKDSESKFLSHESLTPPKAGSPRKRKNFSSSSFKTSHQPQATNHQYLYGIIQGGVFEDLRKKSAEFVVSQSVDGVAIGGVSVGESKKEMRDQIRWVADYLPKDKPVHLLGVGHIDDILDLVKYGVDTFDCVEPTRLARMGTIFQARQRNFFHTRVSPRRFGRGPLESEKNLLLSPVDSIDILKGKYRFDLSKVDENCDCYVCRSFTKSYLHHLFKNRELLAYTLATYHNLWMMERLFEWVREGIEKNIY